MSASESADADSSIVSSSDLLALGRLDQIWRGLIELMCLGIGRSWIIQSSLKF